MSAGGGSVPGNTAVKQEGNISKEVSEGLGKEKEHSKGRLAPSMQHRTKMRGVRDDVPEPPTHPTPRCCCSRTPTSAFTPGAERGVLYHNSQIVRDIWDISTFPFSWYIDINNPSHCLHKHESQMS